MSRPRRSTGTASTPRTTAESRSLCRSCGRPIEPRRSHRGRDDIAYCGRACRARRVSPADRALEAALLDLLATRAWPKTLCPSEVARAARGDGWRDAMEDVRRAARRLANAGQVEFLQSGRVVDPATVRGPIRLRLRADAERP